MPVAMELLVLAMIAYVLGIGAGWLVWGTEMTDEGNPEP